MANNYYTNRILSECDETGVLQYDQQSQHTVLNISRYQYYTITAKVGNILIDDLTVMGLVYWYGCVDGKFTFRVFRMTSYKLISIIEIHFLWLAK